MDAVTYPRRDVQEWLAGTVCMKIDADKHPGLADVFNVRALPRLVLIDPVGRIVFEESGAPAGGQFTLSLSHPRYKAMIETFNARKYSETAGHAYYLRKWFKGTKTGRQADEIYDDLKGNTGFMEAYAAAEGAYDRKLAKARRAIEEKNERRKREEEQRKKARDLKEKADDLYATFGKKYRSYKIYKQIIWEFPDTPEADNARIVLRAHKQRWKEPSKKELQQRKAPKAEPPQEKPPKKDPDEGEPPQ